MQPKVTSRQEKTNQEDQTSASTALEKIRPELNLEKWSIWKPAKSQNAPKARILEREVTLPDGSKMKAKVKVGFTDEGELTTEDRKTYYALVKQWEDNGRSDQYTSFSTRKLAKLLKKKWGTNVIEAITKSLIRLRATPFTWENSYFDNNTKETFELLETFNILSELKIVRRKKDGVVNKEVGYFKFNDSTLTNLITNHTKPLLFEMVMSLRSEIALLLYTYLDLILFDKSIYERRTKELFDDLGLEGDSYKNPSNRKQKLEPALKELQGAPLTTGAIISATLERTKDGEDYKIVIRKGPRKSVKSVVAPAPAEEKDQVASLYPQQGQLIQQAETLVRLFYELFHSNANAHVPSKAVGQAMSLIAQHGFEQAKHVVDFSHRAAPETNYHPQTFGGILQYTTRALVAYEQFHKEQKQAEEQRTAENARLKAEEEQERQEATTRAEARVFFDQLPTEEQHRLMRHYRAQALERNPILNRCSEEVVEREVLRELLRAIGTVPPTPIPSLQPTQERLFDQEQHFSTDTTIELPQQTTPPLEAISSESTHTKELTPLDTVSQPQSITQQGSEEKALIAQQSSAPSTDQPDQAQFDPDTST